MTEQVTLPNGLALRVRAVRPTDKQKLLDAFGTLSSESRRRRFLAHKSQLSEEELRFFTDVDGTNHFALVAFELEGQGNEGSCVAVARFIRIRDDRTVAEVALVVADAYQRLGIGRLLLLRLLAAAAARGVRRVRFYSLADNEPLRRLVKRVSERVTFSSEGGVLTGEFDIPAIDATAAARLSNLRVGCNRLARRLLLVLTALAALWSMSPAHASEQRLIDISRPPGKLVNIGTHRLYLYCIGVGSPTVVFDAGLGGSSLEWFTVQQKLAARTRVCAYDRAGYGWSDTGPGPRTSLRNAMELRALLKHAGIDPPYVLAGHSFGGYNMQLFASLYAKSVAGLVLIDSSHAEQVERFEAEPIGVSIAPRAGTAILMSPPVVPENLPAELFGPFAALMSSGKALRASMDELQHFRLSSHQVRSAPRWPDVPVIVLTRGQRVWTGEGKGELMERLWMQLQDELATRNPHSLHIVARASGHHIHLDQPRVVVRAVALILGAEYGAGSRQAPLASDRDDVGTLLTVTRWLTIHCSPTSTPSGQPKNRYGGAAAHKRVNKF